MRILLTGCNGQVGTELRPFLQRRGVLAMADLADDGLGAKNFYPLDLADAAATGRVLDKVGPQIIVNAAAFTAVDRAETDRETAFEINAVAPGRLATWAREHGALLVHYSTDYVFDGEAERPYLETDATGPVNAYGASKQAGEQAISEAGCRHIILRSSWIYSRYGQNFLRTMLDLAREHSQLRVVSDQHGCPTWARNLARVTDRLISACASRDDGRESSVVECTGLLHYCDSTVATWYDFANLIFELAIELGLLETRPEIEAVSSGAFTTPAVRPNYSVLDSGAIRDRFGIRPVDLPASLRACLEEMALDE